MQKAIPDLPTGQGNTSNGYPNRPAISKKRIILQMRNDVWLGITPHAMQVRDSPSNCTICNYASWQKDMEVARKGADITLMNV